MSTFTGTEVVYNGITLHNVVTREWDQQVTYDESGTDMLYHTLKLSFEGILHTQGLPAAPAWIAPEEGSLIAKETVPGLHNRVARMLGQPRRTLEVTIGEKVLLRCEPADSTPRDGYAARYSPFSSPDPVMDANNGPKPQNVQVQQIVSDKILRISFSIEVSLVLCEPTGGGKPQKVINNRWSMTEQMDANFFITRIIRGRIRLFSSVMGSVHIRKNLVVPELEPGFRRERLEFEELPNGLEATYEITDKQVHTAAPYPATKITGTHTEATDLAGISSYSSMNVRLEGPPNGDKRELMQVLFRVVDSRLKLLERERTQYIIQSGALVDHIGEKNMVELQIRVKTTKGPRLRFINLAKHELGVPLKLESIDGETYHPGVSREPDLYGYTPYTEGPRNPVRAFLHHCYLQSPCSPDHSIGRVDQSGDPEDDGSENPYPEIYGSKVGELEESPGDLYDESHKEAIFTLCRAESTYVTKGARVQMPIARKVDGRRGTRDTSVILGLAGGQCQRIIRIEAERMGQWPEIPEPVDEYTDGDGSLRGTLLEYWDRPMPPTVSVDASTPIYKIEAFYRYAMNRPPRKDEATRVGQLAFTAITQDESALTREQIYKERLEP